jgi:hypothetical protein
MLHYELRQCYNQDQGLRISCKGTLEVKDLFLRKKNKLLIEEILGDSRKECVSVTVCVCVCVCLNILEIDW